MSPFMLLAKAPVELADPSVVQSLEVVGSDVVLQQTPCCVGLGAPRAVISPLPMAEVELTELAADVATVGTTAVTVTFKSAVANGTVPEPAAVNVQ